MYIIYLQYKEIDKMKKLQNVYYARRIIMYQTKVGHPDSKNAVLCMYACMHVCVCLPC